jgi:hypothetical protein
MTLAASVGSVPSTPTSAASRQGHPRARDLARPAQTRAASGIAGFDELLDEAAARAPARSLGTIEDVGFATAGLATDAAKLITGDRIGIDGGYHIMRARAAPGRRATTIERTVGLVMPAVLAVGCLLMLRPFLTAACFALILVIATWPAFDLQQALGAAGRPRPCCWSRSRPGCSCCRRRSSPPATTSPFYM